MDHAIQHFLVAGELQGGAQGVLPWATPRFPLYPCIRCATSPRLRETTQQYIKAKTNLMASYMRVAAVHSCVYRIQQLVLLFCEAPQGTSSSLRPYSEPKPGFIPEQYRRRTVRHLHTGNG